MGFFKSKRRAAPRLEGLSEHLWHYDDRHRRGWRLDVPGSRQVSSAKTRKPVFASAERKKGKLLHYISSGGMRHQARAQRATAKSVGHPERVRRLLAAVGIFWLVFRLLSLD